MAGWTAFPGAKMLGTLVLEGFGDFSPHVNLADEASAEGALWSVFMQGGDLMCWSWSFSHSDADPSDAGLWWLEEAELTMGERSRIGFAQVGVEQDVHVAPLLVPLCQCFYESLRRLGEVDLRALQFNARNLLPDRRPDDRPYIPQSGWFRMSQGPRTNAFIAFDDGFLQGKSEDEFVQAVREWSGIGVFEFGPLAPALPEHAIEDHIPWPPETALSPAQVGLPVGMPEWTPSSAAYALAWVIEVARRDGLAAPNSAIRITRLD
ncbi:hypothetical protein J0H33_08285 [bacterium]|nr:hypothetical protein [bacterium]